MQMKVYSFYNEKGGVGKTTGTLCLLSYFKDNKKKKAIAIDMDPQRSMTL